MSVRALDFPAIFGQGLALFFWEEIDSVQGAQLRALGRWSGEAGKPPPPQPF